MANGNLTQLITSGFDAFNNLWDIDITLPKEIGEALEHNISLRTAEFTPPKFSLKTYKVSYKGIELERLSFTLEYKDNRELRLKFRLDGQYELLESLQSWKHLYYEPAGDGDIKFGAYSSAMGNDYYGTITAKAYKSVGTDTRGLELNSLVNEGSVDAAKMITWQFNEVVLLDVDIASYSREGDSKPQEVECMFIYGNVFEPYSFGAAM